MDESKEKQDAGAAQVPTPAAGSESVYQPTTVECEKAASGMLGTFKKVLHMGTSIDLFSIGGSSGSGTASDRKKFELKRAETISEKNMSKTAEEAALLGSVDPNTMDDIELKNIQSQYPRTRSLSKDVQIGLPNCVEEMVETATGPILVAVQGSRNKPAIITYHDIGLNYASNFQAFFNFPDMRILLDNFCVYHVNAPGQHDGAPTFPDDYEFLSMDELAAQIDYVMTHFKLKSAIGFGVGVGANILARFAINNPSKIDMLCLINCVSTSASWIEWGYQKLNVSSLKTKGMTQSVIDYLMWHHFGKGNEVRNRDLYLTYKNYFEKHVNPVNLSKFINSYVQRSDLKINREMDLSKRKNSDTLQMSVLNITGALSPYVDDTVTLNGRLDPTNSTWMKIQDCGMPLEEKPAKVAEAFRLFLQGAGYATQVGRRPSIITSDKLH